MDKNTADNLDEEKLKKLIANLERKISENEKLRIKYSDDPAKFASSETELFASLDEFQNVSTQPELYHLLNSKNILQKLISLISHENTDISGKVIAILQELTDVEGPYGDNLDDVDDLLHNLHGGGLHRQLVTNFGRLDAKVKEEAQIINNSLAIVDNMADYDTKFAEYSFLDHGLGEWMLEHLRKHKRFNAVKLAIAEMLSVCIRSSAHCTSEFGDLGGVDIVLQQIAYYRRIEPKTGEEHEYLEQLMSLLCEALLDCDTNQEKFLEEEGVDLIESVLREKRAPVKKSNIKFGMLKLFNTLVSSNEDPVVSAACERFIEILGLKVIFPIFNNPKLVLNEKIKRSEYRQFIDEVEEHTSGILLAMMKYCKNPEYTQRILVKLAESNFEKLNRLIELHDKYFKLVVACRDEFEAKNPNPVTDWYDGDSNKYRMLFVLRAADYMILLACYLGNKFETYDPNGGETFTNRVGKILIERPELRHQIMMEAGQHAEEVNDAGQEQNSLKFLMDYFKQINIKKTTSSA